MATAEELQAIHFVSTVAGLKKKARATSASRHTSTTLKDRPRSGLVAYTGAIDDKGAADAPSASATSSYAARRDAIIPRPHPAGSSPWTSRPAPNGKPVPSDLARRLQAARLAQRMSLDTLSEVLRDAPQPTVLLADQLGAYEDGVAHPSRAILERLAAAVKDPSLLRQVSAAPKKQVQTSIDAKQPSGVDRTSSGLDDARMAELEQLVDEQRQLVRECGPPAVPDDDRDMLRRGKLSETRLQGLKQRAQARIDEYEDELRIVSAREFVKELHEASASGTLATVRAGRNRIGDVGAALLAAQLPPSVTTLDLSHNRIASAGLQAFCDAACTPGFAAISVLNLSGNRPAFACAGSAVPSEKAAKTDGALALSRLLSKSSALRELGLAYCGLTESTLRVVLGIAAGPPSADAPETDVVSASSALEALDLSGNQLGTGSASFLLASALRGHSTEDHQPISLAKLRKLDMTCVGMGDDGAAAISDALREGCALTDLALNSNSIGQNGAAALCVSVPAKHPCCCSVQRRAVVATPHSDPRLTVCCTWARACSANAVCSRESSSQVTKLSAAGNAFGPNGGIAFAKLLEQAYSSGADVGSWPRLLKIDLSANNLGGAGERGPQPQPPTGIRSSSSQTKGQGSASPPASPAVSPGRRADTICQPSEHRAGPYNAVVAQVSQMTDDELRKSIEQRKRRAAAGRGGRAQHRASSGRRRRQRPKPAWGFATLVSSTPVAPHRQDENIATLRDDESRPPGAALNSYAGAAPTNDCEPPPNADFVTALRSAMTALRSACANGAGNGQGLRAIKIEGNGLGRHAHEMLSSTFVTFTQPGAIGLELLPDQATGGKNGIEVRAIEQQLQAGNRNAGNIHELKVGMLLQSVAGVPVEKAAGSNTQRFQQVVSMIKSAGRPMTLSFIDPGDSSGHWHRLLDGWITTTETKASDPEFHDKFSTAQDEEMDAALWQRRQEQVAEGVLVDEARVQRIRHELMARLPANLGYITPAPSASAGSRTNVGWPRKSLQQLRRKEQELSRRDDSIAALEPQLRAEAELIGSGLRSVDEVPLQYAGKVEGPHRGFHHRFIKDQTDQAAEMLLAGLNSTDLSMTQLPVREMDPSQLVFSMSIILQSMPSVMFAQHVCSVFAMSFVWSSRLGFPRATPAGSICWRIAPGKLRSASLRSRPRLQPLSPKLESKMPVEEEEECSRRPVC
eukprot:COSAG02_NODE_301_length_25237_cov_19.918490_5_plen_1199_part_00